ncbi:hypothetical protein [Nitrobacter sp.]|uniref:hypothetical protein n=1 Tax=Nitrobacter sp. TaxID=29420 RepID=UPI003F652E6D
MRSAMVWGLASAALASVGAATSSVEAQQATAPANIAPIAFAGRLARWTGPSQFQAAENEVSTSRTRLP